MTEQTSTAASTRPRARRGERPLSLLALMREDLYAAYDRDPGADSLLDVVLFSTGTRIVWSYRRHHWLWAHGAHKLALFLAKRTRRRLSADIHPAATIGRRFTIDHGMGVVIGGTSVIGDDCLLYQGVTLGMNGKATRGSKRHPTLGDNVMVGANAVIIGDVVVGSGTRVGAGSVVVRDVPNDVTVAGTPARIVRDRRYRGPRLVRDCAGSDDRVLNDAGRSPCLKEELERTGHENVRWSCAL